MSKNDGKKSYKVIETIDEILVEIQKIAKTIPQVGSAVDKMLERMDKELTENADHFKGEITTEAESAKAKVETASQEIYEKLEKQINDSSLPKKAKDLLNTLGMAVTEKAKKTVLESIDKGNLSASKMIDIMTATVKEVFAHIGSFLKGDKTRKETFADIKGAFKKLEEKIEIEVGVGHVKSNVKGHLNKVPLHFSTAPNANFGKREAKQHK